MTIKIEVPKLLRGVVLALALALFSLHIPAAAQAASESETVPAAPAAATQLWVDVEGGEPAHAVAIISARQGATWRDAAAKATPFGASARFEVAPGSVDVRLRITKSFDADLAVTFVDGSGKVLSEHLLRDRHFSLDSASDGWLSLSEAVTPAPVPSGSATAAPQASDPAAQGLQGAANGTKPLASTGSTATLVMTAGAVLALAGAAAVLLTRGRNNSTDGAK